MAHMKLKTPIKGLDDSDITTLEIKPVTGAMWLKFGDMEVAKVTSGGGQTITTVELSPSVFIQYLEECTGVPSPILRKLSLKDIQAARAVLQNMFQD